MCTRISLLSVFAFLVGVVVAQDPVPAIQPAEIELSPALVKDVRVFSPTVICVVVDSTDATLRELAKNPTAQADLKKAREMKAAGTNAWYLGLAEKYHVLAAMAATRLAMARKFEDRDGWSINGKRAKALTFYPSSVGGFPKKTAAFSAPEELTFVARIADFVFVDLAEAPIPGEELTISYRDEWSCTITFDPQRNVCWGIKVNQLGYLPNAKKYAYLGGWKGFAGPVDYSAFDGQVFQIHGYHAGAADGVVKLEGTIRLRGRADEQLSRQTSVTGEDLYELDLSALSKSGNYCVVIPGLGRSWPFRIGPDIYGEAFFHTARVMFHQRGNVELGAEHTNWTRGKTTQPIYRGGFVPETDRFYNAAYAKRGPEEQKLGFRDEDGNPVSLTQFTMVAATASDELMPSVTGGWHDAADYDRRVHHYNCVWDFCGAYEMFPEKFADGQLHLPESGNGIPDILDEAAIGVDVFLRTQREDGGVSSWIEQTSHPHAGMPDRDTQAFYVSLPDRLGSLSFAGSAAYLARLMKPFDSARSQVYVEAATRAFRFGSDPANRLQDIKFTVPEKRTYDHGLRSHTLTFNEASNFLVEGGAAHNLTYVLALLQLKAAGVNEFDAQLAQVSVVDTLARALPDAVHPFAFVTPLLDPRLLPDDERSRLLQRLREEAEKNEMAGQQRLAYRQYWRAPDHRFYHFMSWGQAHSARRARLPLLLWRVTNQQRYRQAVLHGLDWQFGCNALGRSLTTGLGSMFPTIVQHNHSSYDTHLEPLPGISPYTYTFGMPFQAWGDQFGIVAEPHASVKHFFPNTALPFIPKSAGGTELQSMLNMLPKDRGWAGKGSTLIRDTIGERIPVMRRNYVHPYTLPAQNEFTINESISPHAAVLGAMLPESWQPSSAMKQRTPRNREQELPIYLQP